MKALYFAKISEIEVNELGQVQIQAYLQEVEELPLYNFSIEKQMQIIAFKIRLIRELHDLNG